MFSLPGTNSPLWWALIIHSGLLSQPSLPPTKALCARADAVAGVAEAQSIGGLVGFQSIGGLLSEKRLN